MIAAGHWSGYEANHSVYLAECLAQAAAAVAEDA